MESKNLTSFISMVQDDNLAQAQAFLKDRLNEKLGQAISDKFQEYAGTIFEAKKSQKKKEKKEEGARWQDSDGDGKWYEPGDDVKAVNEETYCEDGNCEEMEDDETKGKKPHGKEEEEASDNESRDENEEEEETEEGEEG